MSLTDEWGSFVADRPNGVSRFDRGVEVQLHAEVASSLNPPVQHTYIDYSIEDFIFAQEIEIFPTGLTAVARSI